MTLIQLACHNLLVQRARGFVLDIPGLQLEASSITAVCGPNGSGKSTLLLACAGLCDLEGGRVELTGGLCFRGRAPALAGFRRKAVLVHQEPYLLRGSVLHNLSWGLRLRRVGTKERAALCRQTLASLEIEDLGQSDVAGLSGGQRTLVAVARALVLQPPVLLLDEVTRDLDTHHKQAVLSAVRDLVELGSAVMLATHDQKVIQQLATGRVSLQRGQLVEAEIEEKAPQGSSSVKEIFYE